MVGNKKHEAEVEFMEKQGKLVYRNKEKTRRVVIERATPNVWEMMAFKKTVWAWCFSQKTKKAILDAAFRYLIFGAVPQHRSCGYYKEVCPGD